MRWQRAAPWLVGVLLLVGAGTVSLLQVRVRSAAVSAACGSPFDVFSGRSGWQDWYAQDLGDPRLRTNDPLVRTEACPSALNRRIVLAGALTAAGLAALAVLAAPAMKRRQRGGRTRSDRVRLTGLWMATLGAVLTIAGLFGLVVLLVNPNRTLFVYVDRWLVAIIGLVLLVPAVALAAGGRGLMLLAGAPPSEEVVDDAAS